MQATIEVGYSTALAIIEQKDVQVVFTTPGAIDPVLAKIAAAARSFAADVETTQGRKDIASMAFKVARTKTYLDGLGKELVDGLKDLPKKVDANRKNIREFLDSLRDEVRKPLTEWEAQESRKEAERLANIEAARLAKEIEVAHEFALLMDADFDRRKAEAAHAKEAARKEAEERIAKEAAEKATREAEAKSEAEKVAAYRREVEARMAQERAEREKAEADTRAKLAEERAERAQAEAVKQERERREQEERIAKEEQSKREANIAYRGQVHSESIADISGLGIDKKVAAKIVDAIAKGKVRHLDFNY